MRSFRILLTFEILRFFVCVCTLNSNFPVNNGVYLFEVNISSIAASNIDFIDYPSIE